MSIIKLKNVKKKYEMGGEEFYALKDINMDVQENEFTMIMGPSGSGKSTMLNILGCLDNPTEGDYHLDGNDVTQMTDDELSEIRNKKIGFVFQSFNLLPKLSVYENTTLPFHYSGLPDKHIKQRGEEVLELVGLQDKMNNKPNQLSGGQRQRVAIARSLVMKPAMILADEPTGNLDTKTSEQIMNIFTKIHKQGSTIVMITHEPEISEYGTKILNLRDGFIN